MSKTISSFTRNNYYRLELVCGCNDLLNFWLISRSRDLEDKYFDEESDNEDHVTEEDNREFNPPPLRAKQQEGS